MTPFEWAILGVVVAIAIVAIMFGDFTDDNVCDYCGHVVPPGEGIRTFDGTYCDAACRARKEAGPTW